jgi:hypothetical protein
MKSTVSVDSGLLPLLLVDHSMQQLKRKHEEVLTAFGIQLIKISNDMRELSRVSVSPSRGRATMLFMRRA